MLYPLPDDQVLVYAACTVSDSFNWTKRVQRVQFMETQTQHLYWYNITFSCGLLFLVGLRWYCPLFLLPGFFPSPWSFKYFHASTVNLQNCLLFYNCFASQTPGLALSFSRLPFNLQLSLYVFFCTRALSHEPRVCGMLCLQFGSLWVWTLCHIQWCSSMRAFSHEHEVCAMLCLWFPFNFNPLLYSVMFFLCVRCLTNIRFMHCSALAASLWFERASFIISNVRVCVLCFTNIGFVQCYSLVSL